MRSSTPRNAVVLSLLVLSGTTGCFTTSPGMMNLADTLESDLGGTRLEHQFGLTFGRMSLGLAKGITRIATRNEDADPALDVLKGIKKFEMASFEARSSGSRTFPAELDAALADSGWETLARFRDGGEFGWVAYQLDRDRLKRVLVIALDDEELILVRLKGRLDKVLTAALAYSRQQILDEGVPRPSQEAEEWEEWGRSWEGSD